MSKLLLSIAILVTLAATANAQSFTKPQKDFLRPFGPMTTISTGACFGGLAADMLSSRGGYELNPILRNANGSPNLKRGFLLGSAACGVSFLFERKAPKVAHVFRFIVGGIHFGAAAHNLTVH